MRLQKAINTLSLSILILTSLKCQIVQGQDIHPLKIGDAIPEAVWNMPLEVVNHPQAKETITLNDYRDKQLIIIEFWGSRCPPCIQAVDKLNRFQSRFGNRFAALPVLTRSHLQESTLDFINKRGWTLPSVVNDTILDRNLFSHYLPDWGDVWIYNGRLLAVPQFGFLDGRTINAVLNGGTVNFVNKSNVPPIDLRTEIFREPLGEGFWWKSKHTAVGRYLPFHGKDLNQPVHYELQGHTTRLAAWNLNIGEMYYEAFKADIHPKLTATQAISWELDNHYLDSLINEPAWDNPIEGIPMREHWREQHWFGYQLIVHQEMSETAARRQMQKDVNTFFRKYFELDASVENKIVHRYAVLRLLGEKVVTEKLLSVVDTTKKVLNTDTDWAYQNFPKTHLYMHVDIALENVKDLNLTIPNLIDSTGLAPDFKVTFSIPKAIRFVDGLGQINTELKRYGLHVTIEEQKVPVLVVRHKKPAFSYSSQQRRSSSELANNVPTNR